jgi:hypothetical protein
MYSGRELNKCGSPKALHLMHLYYLRLKEWENMERLNTGLDFLNIIRCDRIGRKKIISSFGNTWQGVDA